MISRLRVDGPPYGTEQESKHVHREPHDQDFMIRAGASTGYDSWGAA